jgi:sialic acid synthase SpsE
MANQSIRFGDWSIGEESPVFIVAEIGINHNGDIKLAEQLLVQAKEAGADAVKLQTYVTEKRVPKDSPIFDLLKECELSERQQQGLFKQGRELGLCVFSTPFDDEAVDFLAREGVPLFKVASFDVVNTSLLEKIAAVKRPVILSRGMATRGELDSAVKIMDRQAIPSALLHCISAYPVTSDEDLNLTTIPYLKREYLRPVGYSDHTLGTEAPVWAVAAGARVIEKHFTLDTTLPGPDHAISTDPMSMKEMVTQIRRVERALGTPALGPIAAEEGILQYRRPT